MNTIKQGDRVCWGGRTGCVGDNDGCTHHWHEKELHPQGYEVLGVYGEYITLMDRQGLLHKDMWYSYFTKVKITPKRNLPSWF